MKIAPAIEKGIEFLRQQQLPSGQFPIEVTRPWGDGIITHLDESPFATTHIVYALGFLPRLEVQDMIDRALVYFQSEMSGHGLWNYWNKAAKWGDISMYHFEPADLDDTAGISYLLRNHNIPFPDNRGLLSLNRNRAGLFYTWFMMRPVPTINRLYWRTVKAEANFMRFTLFFMKTEANYRDIDGVVNANILLYLGETPETKSIINWLIQIVQTEQEANCDKWYLDPFTFYYALSRNYHAGIKALGEVKANIINRLETHIHADGRIGEHALHTALAANTLLNFGERGPLLEKSLDFLFKNQREDGSWERQPYYYGGPKKFVYFGSDALTTSICLEALHRFQTDN